VAYHTHGRVGSPDRNDASETSPLPWS
jgi:hypothetical protein